MAATARLSPEARYRWSSKARSRTSPRRSAGKRVACPALVETSGPAGRMLMQNAWLFRRVRARDDTRAHAAGLSEARTRGGRVPGRKPRSQLNKKRRSSKPCHLGAKPRPRSRACSEFTAGRCHVTSLWPARRSEHHQSLTIVLAMRSRSMRSSGFQFENPPRRVRSLRHTGRLQDRSLRRSPLPLMTHNRHGAQTRVSASNLHVFREPRFNRRWSDFET